MVVRFFQFLWLLWILTSSEAKITLIGTKQGFCQSFYFPFPLRLVNMFFSEKLIVCCLFLTHQLLIGLPTGLARMALVLLQDISTKRSR